MALFQNLFYYRGGGGWGGGGPQGSVMGPLEYILYTGPLCEIISAHPDIQYARVRWWHPIIYNYESQ